MNITKTNNKPNTPSSIINEVLTIVIDSPAELQIMYNALELYKNHYYAQNHNKENYNEHHQQRAEQVFEQFREKEMEFTKDNFFVGQRLMSIVSGKVWEIITLDKTYVMRGKQRHSSMIMRHVTNDGGLEESSFISEKLLHSLNVDDSWKVL